MEKDSQQVYNELKNRFDSVVEQDGTDSALEKLWIGVKSIEIPIELIFVLFLALTSMRLLELRLDFYSQRSFV